MEHPALNVAVVGGGLAGLSTAALLARGGGSVTVFERATAFGGRARTTEADGYHLNLGPHALYRGGPAARVLADLGVTYRGGAPGAGTYALLDGRLRTMPTGPVSLLSTDLVDLAGKFQFAQQMLGLRSLDYAALAGTTLRAWLDAAVPHAGVRAVVETLVRLATYCADTDRLSAGAALAQLAHAVRSGVLYLHGGWQTLVDGVRAAAERAGARLVSGAPATAIVRDARGAARGVTLEDGRTVAADVVVAAVGPAQVLALLGGDDPVVAAWCADSSPVHAACLDVALRRLPRPHARILLGIDRPVYASVHSSVARLAPRGGAVVHVARYLTAAHPRGDEDELAAVLDVLQPGWREELVTQRFLPHLTVTQALPEARRGGLAGRPGPAVDHVPGLYVVGDWVGPRGMLADAAFASADATARAVLASVTSGTSASSSASGVAAGRHAAVVPREAGRDVAS
jgi:phytoene dehydrogenase-like protein